MERVSHRFGSLVTGALMLVGCGAAPTTQRVFHGEVVVGPYVEPEAYAAFAEGVYLEQRGDVAGAVRAFRRAQALDEDGPSIAARLGALICRTNLEAALEEFQTSGIARDYAPAWVERALCLSRHGASARALEAAHRAVMLDPGNPDANLLVAELHHAGAHTERARAWLFAWALAEPDAAAHARELEARARRLGDPALGALARSNLDLGRAEGAEDDPGGATTAPVRAALLAPARGEPEQAVRDTTLALAANPNDSDALVIALFASSLSLDDERFLELLERGRANAAPGPEAAALMAELIRCRVGDAAADSWRAAYRRRTTPMSTGPSP
jgi:tetratricopeptide (TPR) repeat protein